MQTSAVIDQCDDMQGSDDDDNDEEEENEGNEEYDEGFIEDAGEEEVPVVDAMNSYEI